MTLYNHLHVHRAQQRHFISLGVPIPFQLIGLVKCSGGVTATALYQMKYCKEDIEYRTLREMAMCQLKMYLEEETLDGDFRLCK